MIFVNALSHYNCLTSPLHVHTSLGISSCCLWIEDKKEETDSWSNQAILFDEDLFMHIKNSPSARMNRLNLGQFNLILRAFLRTQCLNTLISTEDKNMSLFS